MSNRLRTVVALTLLAGIIPAAIAGLPALRIAQQRDRAERLYRAQSFGEAYDAFRGLGRMLMDRRQMDATPPVSYNTGVAAYRMGRFDDAIRSFREALGGSPSLQERGHFNLGNAYVWLSRAESDKRGSLRGAINAYEDALVLDPHDADAKWNLELAVQRLSDEEQRMGGQHRGDADWGGGNVTIAGYAGTPQTGGGASPGAGFGNGAGEDPEQQLSEPQARRLLRAVEQAQVTGQDVHRGIRPDARPSRRRDW